MNSPDNLNNLATYLPHGLLKNSHLMTIVPGFLPQNNSIKGLNEQSLLIPVDQESTVLAHAHIDKAVDRCLVIVHGLEGSSESSYVLRIAQEALALRYNVVRLNLRNCGNTLHLTPTLYNAGQSEDLFKVLDWLKQNKGQSKQYVIGYSLGGNLVLKALAELNSGSSIEAACAISPSIDLSASVDSLAIGINRIYEYYFLRSLKKKIVAKHKLFPERYKLGNLSKVNSIRDFDDLFTAPIAGYKNAAHYYRSASALPLLEKIKTRTLIIAAQDDPLIPFKSFTNINNAHIQLLAPEHGGHVSFLADNGSNNANAFWADMQILSFCCEQSKIKENTFNV